ncbi:UNVERIFIED_CONTAM: hypothetical protein GTU68_065951 [Idotea baltica]|nr:hypothetical protein [Idotea baltica]
MSIGDGLSIGFQAKRETSASPRTIDCSSMRCFGSRKRRLLGGICPSDSGTGIQSFSDSIVGPNVVFGNKSQRRYLATRTWSG